MKVFVVTPYWTPIPGGIARYCSSLVRELRRLGSVDPHVLSREGAVGPGVRIVGGSPTQFIRRVRRILESERPEVVHCHSHWYGAWAAVRYRHRHPDSRLIFSFHTDWGRASPLRRRALEVLLARCDYVTFVSWSQAERITERYRLRSPFVVFPPGGDTEPDEPMSLGPVLEGRLRALSPLVAWVGPLQHEKKALGVAALLQAWPQVLERHPSAGLAIAGDGEFRPLLKSRSRELGLEGSVKFLGALPRTTPLLKACDVYVHASYQEGMPLALLEAMYLGRPIVATRTGGIPEALAGGKCGLLVDGSPEELARGINDLLDNPRSAAEHGARAAARARDRYTWGRVAALFASLYGIPGSSRVHISIDVENDYGPSGTRTYRGITEGLPRLLEILSRHHVRASVFLTGDCLERFANLAGQLDRMGHVVGSHAEHTSRSFGRLPHATQAAVLERTAALIAQGTSKRPTAFRAPNFDVRPPTFRALASTGYEIDSSMLPGRRVRRWRFLSRLDHRGTSLTPYRASASDPKRPGRDGIIEIPVSPNPEAPGGPVGLGFLHTRGLEATLRAIDRSPARRAVFLIHPWEAIDRKPSPRDPPWLSAACSSNLSALDELLGKLRREGRIVSFEDEFRAVDGLEDGWGDSRDFPALVSR